MSNNASFLPEDYLAQKIERRTNVISLILFAVVMAGVGGAFFLTTHKWKQVKANQTAINTRYEQAAEEIRDLAELEAQKDQMLDKAELAAALVERVPRSILLAELINRMPERLSLVEFDLKSEKMKPYVARMADPDKKPSSRLKPKKAATKEQVEKEAKKVQPPRYLVRVALVGVAPGDLEVSKFLAELNAYPLLDDVSLVYTEEKEFDQQLMREFKINMVLETDADIRDIDPMVMPRDAINNSLTNELRFPTTEAEALSAASTDDAGTAGD
jgi:hypothetical protein